MKNKYIFLILFSLGIASCQDSILNLDPISSPTDATFFSNEEELELALTGTYRSLYWISTVPTPMLMDVGGSDIGVNRGLGGGGFLDVGAGSHSTETGGIRDTYSRMYTGIGRANNLLNNMSRAADVVSADRFSEIEAQALALRAYYYHWLVFLFGDVPYTEQVLTPEEALLERTNKETVIDNILRDLALAADKLPVKFAENGRITKGIALGLRARVALYAGRYNEAAASAKAVMDLAGEAGYALHGDYHELFSRGGQASSEVMLTMPLADGFIRVNTPRRLGSRNRGSWSQLVPTQSMVDSYECIDGLPIDESPLYNPKTPFANRDPRLHASIMTPQSVWAGLIFESHPDSTTYRNADGTPAGANNDCRVVKWPAAFCGYLWKKYTDEVSQIDFDNDSDINFILMRYAEILLIYAEAQIESNSITSSTLDAINQIRARAYGVGVGDTDQYPAVTTTNQSELRRIIRRERKIELAIEGFRFLDIRRFGIAEKVMPVTIYGRILDPSTATGIPQIDEDGFVDYTGIEAQYDLNTDDRFPNAQNRIFTNPRDYLLPIPQAEIDTYKGNGSDLRQNDGY
jgi:hypothetical protein